MKRATVRDRGARFLLVTAALVIVVAGLREIKPIALPLLVAIFLSVLSAPLLGWLTRHRVPKLLAVVATVLANIAVIAALLLLVGGSTRAFIDAIPSYQERLEEGARDTAEWLEDRGIAVQELRFWLAEGPVGESPDLLADDPTGAEATVPIANADGSADENREASSLRAEDETPSWISAGSILDLIGSTLRGVATLLSTALLIFLMLVFLLFEIGGLPRRLQIAFGWQGEELGRVAKAQREVQHYLVIKTLISLTTGTLVTGWVWLWGVDFPLLWGLVAFLFNYIPSLGSILAAIPPVLLAMIDMGPGRALVIGLGYLAVNLVLGNFLEPHLMGRRLGISTLVVFLSLIFWGWVWGPVGMLLSVPLTMVLKIVLENTEDFRWLAQIIGTDPQVDRV